MMHLKPIFFGLVLLVTRICASTIEFEGGSQVDGVIRLIDDEHVRINAFDLNGKQNVVFHVDDQFVRDVYEVRPTSTGEYRIKVNFQRVDKLPPNTDIVLKLPRNWNQLTVEKFDMDSERLGIARRHGRRPDPDARPRLLPELSRLHYGVGSGSINVIDTKTIIIHGFEFDGESPPDGWFVAGQRPISKDGVTKLIWRENRAGTKRSKCGIEKKQFSGESDVVIILPGSATVYDIDYLSVYCYRYSVDFGHTEFKLNRDQHPVPEHLPPIVEELPQEQECED